MTVKLKKRSFDEMIKYFNNKVADMDISPSYKMELLGMITEIGFKYEKDVKEPKTGKWIPCSERRPEEDGLYIVACGFHGEHSTFAYWNGDYWSIKTPVIAWMPGIEPYKMSEEEIREDDMRMNYTLDLREVIKAGLIKDGGLND